MLVLTREIRQSIWIGDDIKIVVLSESDGVVRVGIEAPREVNVSRAFRAPTPAPTRNQIKPHRTDD